MWQIILDGLSVLDKNGLIVFCIVSLLSLGCCANFFLFRNLAKQKNALRSTFSLFLLILFFVFSIIVRLAYLKDIFVPPYFDSVEHLRIIKELVEGFSTSTFLELLPNLTPDYYHLGFHFIASLLTFGLRADPINVILVFGQIILAAMPIPIFFLIWHKTQSGTAAFFALLLAGFGWYMPGFAINWGKYPALTGLLAFEIVLSIAYALSKRKTGQNQSVLIIFLIFGVLASTLIHTRTLVILFISFASWFFAGRIHTLPQSYQYSMLRIQLLGILILGILIQKDPLLKLALEPYLDNGILIALIALILSPFALSKFPRGVYFNALFVLSIFACLFIPFNGSVLKLTNQTLLDRPFVEMILYLPLSLLGGLGLAGFLESLKNTKILSKQNRLYTKALTTFLFIGFIGFFSIKNYNFYPVEYCNFLKYDDTVILDWMDKNLPSDARILVASDKLNVVPSSISADLVGSDAGIWVHLLTDKKTILMPYELDFLSTETIEELCQNQIGYIYVGSTSQSFNTQQLRKEVGWYKEILFLPNAQLYQLKSCFPKN